MTEIAELKRRGELISPEKRLKTSCGGREGSSVKEKDRFGQRVAALQQLVSPFGKVLCMPYFQGGEAQEEMNLRSQGLCLVPVAKTLAIASSNGADIWAPPAA